MKYLSYVGHQLTTKNKLQKELREWLISKDRILINTEEDLEAYKKMVVNKVSELNEKHTRCKPIKVHWWHHGFNNDYHLSGAGFCQYMLYEITNEFIPNSKFNPSPA
ncbi:MAG: hypothetical protein ABJI69_09135 [Balneola sp.]